METTEHERKITNRNQKIDVGIYILHVRSEEKKKFSANRLTSFFVLWPVVTDDPDLDGVHAQC